MHGANPSAIRLPSVDRVLTLAAVQPLLVDHGRTAVLEVLRGLLATARQHLHAGAPAPGWLIAGALDQDVLVATLARQLAEAAKPRLRPVFNLTGTVLHTNLGRAMLAPEAIAQVAATMGTACNLEFDLERGERGERDRLVEDLLASITGAEAATVVNNCAAAVLLVIAALANRKDVLISRGELVEIGGSFRMPDVMASAGARMVEVGTTNRTHLADFEQAITARTALLLKVHTSNYAVQGFTSVVPEGDLAALGREHGIPLAIDLGSGSLVDLSAFGLPAEPMPQAALAAGAGVVMFSGDKLLGGPQAGLIVGTRALIQRIRKHPLKRALRVSRLTLAALEATLQLYRHPEVLATRLPTLRLLTRDAAEISAVAERLRAPLATAVGEGFEVTTQAMLSQIGSGSLPVDRLPSAGLAIAARTGSRRSGAALVRLAEALRRLPQPVVGRLHEQRLLLDLRCLEDEDGFLAQLPLLRDLLPA